MILAAGSPFDPVYNFFGAILAFFYGIIPNLGVSIILLTILVMLVMFPLTAKQAKSMMAMQRAQPEIKKLQAKYKNDRAKLNEEMMKFYQENKINPLAGCLPLLIQMPIFLALFRLLDHAAKTSTANGLLTSDLAYSFGHAKLFGTIPISATFVRNNGLVSVQILAAVLVVAMTATTFMTQRQLMSKNMPADALSGPYAQQQKMLLYVLPLVFAVGGIAFPIGVLMYWTTSNLWTMGQQFYVIRNNPAPNTEAFRAKEKRDAAKAAARGEVVGGTTVAVEEIAEDRRPVQRQQPKKQSRQQRRTQAPKSQSPSSDSSEQGENS
jgi:YidC/Oxa1 family membrane protein insertase